MRKYVISITGNTAAGTTTLAKRLSQVVKWQAIYSETYLARSPFFSKFLQDHKRWAFHNQTFFVAEYIEMYQRVTRSIEPMNGILCLDYTIFELTVYTRAMKENGILDQEEYEVLTRVFELLRPNLLIPDLLIYLTANVDVLIQRMNERKRSGEKNMDRAYIEALQVSFDNFVGAWDKGPILVIDSEEYDFRYDDSAVRFVANQALGRIN